MSDYRDLAGRVIPEAAAKHKSSVLSNVRDATAQALTQETPGETWSRLVRAALHQLDEMIHSTNHIERQLALKLVLDHAPRFAAIMAVLSREERRGRELDLSKLTTEQLTQWRGLIELMAGDVRNAEQAKSI